MLIINYSSSKQNVGLNTTPMPILAILALSLLFNVFVGIGLADKLITAENRTQIQSFGKNWLHKVLALSHHRKQKQNKRNTENKKTEEKKKETFHKVPEPSFQDYSSWSSDFFDNFGITDFSQEWSGSHSNPIQSQY